MIGRWPIRVRLTAAFTAVMALVLAGMAIGTLLSFGATFDESLDTTLATRLAALSTALPGPAPALLGGTPAGDPVTVAQVLDATTGTVLSSSPLPGATPLLTPTELTTARRGQLRAEHSAVAGLPGPVRILAAPLPSPVVPGRVVPGAPATGGAVGVVAISVAGRNAAVGDLAGELLIALPIVLLAAALGGYLLGAAALAPVERMRTQAAAITPTDPDPRLPVGAARDEISRLGATLNALLARLHTALARERQFTADAGHELRTPLSMLTTELELALLRPRSTGELTTALRSALEETDRLSRLAQDLLLLAGTDTPDHRSTGQGSAGQGSTVIELRPVLQATLTRHHPLAPSDASPRSAAPGPEDAAMLDCPAGLRARVGADDLTRAVTNLIDNARRHGGAPITVTARPATDPAGRPLVRIEVRDHGPGIDPEFLPRAMERFTRADPARTGAGAGLGLAITAALACRHHGTLTAANHPDGGALLTLTLPAAADTQQPQTDPAEPAAGRAATHLPEGR